MRSHVIPWVMLGLFAAGSGAQAERPLNVVFILADDLGWTDLGCFGSSFYETPHLDALAARGMRFVQAYAACPVCSPTRASILAGKYPARMNTTDYFGGGRKGKLLPAPYVNRLPLEELSMAEAFQAAGYATCFVGKWHLGGKGFHPEDQGFDANIGGFRRGHPPAGYFSPYKNPKLEDGPKGEHLTDRLTTDALSWLTAHRADPFFLYLSYYQVHTPLQAKKEDVARHRARKKALPPPAGPRWGKEGRRKVRLVQDHAVYAAMVESLDRNVGRVVKELDALGLTESTAIVFMSDNGGLSTSEGHPTSNLPLRAGKGWLYEGGVREPMFIVWPGQVRPGRVCATPVISTDFYPTLLEMAGLPGRRGQHVDGTSLVPLLMETGSLAPRDLFWHYPHYGNQGGSPGGSIRSGNLKLIQFFEDDRVELYDLAADLSEKNDLAAARPDQAKDLLSRLEKWREVVEARMPKPNPNYRR